jgi:catechol-2,3-dioxygenase
MVTLAGYSHISLSVRDRDASVRWYGEVLGFAPFQVLDNECFMETICIHPDSGMVLCLQQHPDNVDEPFAPQLTGLDHVAFRVDSREELDGWQARLAELGVRHSPIADEEYGAVLCLRDPDEIQLELFYRPDHP